MNLIQKAGLRARWLRRLLARVVGNGVVWMRRTESQRRFSGRRLSQSDFFAVSNDLVVPALTLLDDIGDGIWMVTLSDHGPGARGPSSGVGCFNTKEAAETFIAEKKWLAIRKEAGLKIDPETAEVHWIYALTMDPYGVCPYLPEEYQQVGREYFARSPGSDVWVHFSDLPDATRDALRAKIPAGLAVLQESSDRERMTFAKTRAES
jgi:hypothetical protein